MSALNSTIVSDSPSLMNSGEGCSSAVTGPPYAMPGIYVHVPHAVYDQDLLRAHTFPTGLLWEVGKFKLALLRSSLQGVCAQFNPLPSTGRYRY